MIDWYTVQYLYPKAFERFSNIMFPNVGVLSLSTLEYYDTKKLYHFFDKEGVYLTIEMYNPHQWTQTEYDGFIECFRILDKILNDRIS